MTRLSKRALARPGQVLVPVSLFAFSVFAAAAFSMADSSILSDCGILALLKPETGLEDKEADIFVSQSLELNCSGATLLIANLVLLRCTLRFDVRLQLFLLPLLHVAVLKEIITGLT